jgi:hypothetical protein
VVIRVLICALVLSPADGQDDRAPVPSVQAQKAAEKLIHEIFKDDYSKNSASDKAQFAAKLVRQAADTKDDPTSRYVLLRDARDLSAQAGDLRTLFLATDELVRGFDVQAIGFKLAAYGAAASTVRTPEDQLRLSQAYLSLSHEAALAGDGDGAQKAVTAAASLARKAKDLAAVGKADAAAKELAELRGKLESFKKASDTLASSPDDAPSNEVVGEWWCFVRGDWEKGLPYLAKGTELKSVAKTELAKPGSATDQVALGDSWWDLGDKKAGAARENLRKHGAYWYSAAVGQLTGLTRVRIEKRLKDVPPDLTGGALPGTITFTSADQLSKFRSSGGTWKIEDGELLGTCPDHGQWATFGTAYSSMSEVSIRVPIVPPAKSNFRYWVGNLHFIFNHEIGNRTELRVGTKMVVVNREFLTPGKEQEVTLRQEGSNVVLLIDGKKEWEAEATMSGTVSVQAAHGSTIGIRQLRIVGSPDPAKEVVAETRPIP